MIQCCPLMFCALCSNVKKVAASCGDGQPSTADHFQEQAPKSRRKRKGQDYKENAQEVRLSLKFARIATSMLST